MKYLKPTRIVAFGGEVRRSENLLKDYPMQMELWGENFTEFHGKSFVILDFGKEISGGIRIFTNKFEGSNDVHIRFGESIGEVCADLGYKNAGNDHSPRDIMVKVSLLSDLTFGQTGFRFVRLDIHHDGDTWLLRNVIASIDTDEREEVGHFESDDEELNAIWNTASNTLRLCLHNGLFWDGVKRDRLCWIGDAFPETLAATCLYRDLDVIENTIATGEKEYPLPLWMNFSATYSLSWLNMIITQFEKTGDKALANAHMDYIRKLTKQFEGTIQDGDFDIGWKFIDWPSCYDGGESEEDLKKKNDTDAGVCYYYRYTFMRLIAMAKELGEEEIAAVANSILTKISTIHPDVKKYKQIAALGVLTDSETVHNATILTENGANGLSTFQSYFIFSALAKLGEYDKAMEQLKEYYGGMLKMGATSFWEDFDIAWMEGSTRIDEMPVEGKKDIHGDFGKFCYTGYRHSLCHGWSSGVIPYIVENVVGLKRVGFGDKNFIIHPHLSHLKNIHLVYPLAEGVIDIRINKEGGKLHIDVQKPDDVNVTTA